MTDPATRLEALRHRCNETDKHDTETHHQIHDEADQTLEIDCPTGLVVGYRHIRGLAAARMFDFRGGHDQHWPWLLIRFPKRLKIAWAIENRLKLSISGVNSLTQLGWPAEFRVSAPVAASSHAERLRRRNGNFTNGAVSISLGMEGQSMGR